MKALLAILGISIVITCFGSIAGAERYPSLQYPLANRSIASVSGVEGTFFNPAVLKASQGLELGFYHSFNDSTFNGDNGIAFTRGGVGFSYYSLRLDGRPRVNSWTFAYGTRHSSKFLFGGSYTFYKTDRAGYNNDHFWKAGGLFRPNRQISVGAVVNNINRMEFASSETQREYTLGFGIRPHGGRVTISGDYMFFGGEQFTDGSFTGFTEIELKEGLWLQGHVAEGGEFGLGLSFAFGESLTGSYANFDDKAGFSRGVLSQKYSYNRSEYAFFEPNRYIVLKLSGSYPEEREVSFLWRKGNRTFTDLVLGLDRISNDEHIIGVALRIGRTGFGWAQLEELRDELSELRRKGKTVVAFLEPLSGTGSYYLASVANKIAMQRVDVLSITGLLAEVTFYKGMLDKLGIDAELEHSGDYKTASDLVTREDISTHHREAIDAILDDLWAEITVRISGSRGIPRENLLSAIDAAPLTSNEAVELSLIDTLIYPDLFDEWAKSEIEESSGISFEKYVDAEDYGTRWGESPRVAVIPAEGSIVRGRSSHSFLTGKMLGSSTLNHSIRSARENKSVKAVVLRVNSPGGETLGSESMWRELKLTQEKKPVIVSMGNVAASGGYHISSASDWILARNMTITGSIGVIYGKLDLSGLRNRIGLSTFHLKRGENADFYTMTRGYTDQQREKVRSEIRLIYEDFVDVVAANRNTSPDEIDKVAQGRTWSGSRALQHNLIDQIGGLTEAIDVACEKANLDREEIDIDIIPTRKFPLLLSMYPVDFAARVVQFVFDPDMSDVSSELSAEFGEGWLYRSPYELRIR
jgi:protease-4